MLFFPIAVDVPMSRWPIMNWVMMGGIVFCFVLQAINPSLMERFILGIGETGGYKIGPFGKVTFYEVDEHFLSWVGHMFLHADGGHLFGNLVFMWVFGNAVCAKVGNFWYPLLWIGSGLLAAMAESVMSEGAMLGASGAISGIVGFYIVFYFQNDISIFYWFLIRVGTFSLSSYWVVGFYFLSDILGVVSHDQGVAYFAHLGGTIGGFSIAVFLVKRGILEPTDQERTIVDMVQHKSTREQLSKDYGELRMDRFDPSTMKTYLHVHIGNGEVEQITVQTLLKREQHGVEVNDLMVSVSSEKWTSFRDWRNRHHC